MSLEPLETSCNIASNTQESMKTARIWSAVATWAKWGLLKDSAGYPEGPSAVSGPCADEKIPLPVAKSSGLLQQFCHWEQWFGGVKGHGPHDSMDTYKDLWPTMTVLSKKFAICAILKVFDSTTRAMQYNRWVAMFVGCCRSLGRSRGDTTQFCDSTTRTTHCGDRCVTTPGEYSAGKDREREGRDVVLTDACWIMHFGGTLLSSMPVFFCFRRDFAFIFGASVSEERGGEWEEFLEDLCLVSLEGGVWGKEGRGGGRRGNGERRCGGQAIVGCARRVVLGVGVRVLVECLVLGTGCIPVLRVVCCVRDVLGLREVCMPRRACAPMLKPKVVYNQRRSAEAGRRIVYGGTEQTNTVLLVQTCSLPKRLTGDGDCTAMYFRLLRGTSADSGCCETKMRECLGNYVGIAGVERGPEAGAPYAGEEAGCEEDAASGTPLGGGALPSPACVTGHAAVYDGDDEQQLSHPVAPTFRLLRLHHVLVLQAKTRSGLSGVDMGRHGARTRGHQKAIGLHHVTVPSLKRRIVLSEDEGCLIPDCTISSTEQMVTCLGPSCNARRIALDPAGFGVRRWDYRVGMWLCSAKGEGGMLTRLVGVATGEGGAAGVDEDTGFELVLLKY
ncbi:hypothetical protein C8R45DRAFT_933599 [Mycena sanguinolenta]|nr:hypothetical protein C8R45DRAFT_933599 [Mycena sanguinolenta]